MFDIFISILSKTNTTTIIGTLIYDMNYDFLTASQYLIASFSDSFGTTLREKEVVLALSHQSNKASKKWTE